MSDISIEVKTKITLELTMGEAGALDAIVGYGVDSFKEVFKKHMGKSYIEPYEDHLNSLFTKCRNLSHSVKQIKTIIDGIPKLTKVD